MKYVLIIMSIFLAVAGQLMLKRGVAASELAPAFGPLLRTLFSPLVFIGFLCYGVGAVIWLFVLQRFPLSIAYPAMALSYVIVIFFSWFFLHESLTLPKLAAIFFIILGVIILSRA